VKPAYVTVGKLRLTLTHLKCLRLEELAQWVGREEAERLLERAARHRVLLKPLIAELRHPAGSLTLSPGLALLSGVEFAVNIEPLTVGGSRDDDFLWELLIEVPQLLEVERRPVLVEEPDARFSRHAREGVLYALDIMERVSSVYKVPFIVTGSAGLASLWRWLHTVIRARGWRGEELVVVDGEVKVL